MNVRHRPQARPATIDSGAETRREIRAWPKAKVIADCILGVGSEPKFFAAGAELSPHPRRRAEGGA